MTQSIQAFTESIQAAAQKNELVKISFGGKRHSSGDLNNVFVKPVLVKGEHKLCFVYRHATKDITKNFDSTEAATIVEQLLARDFYHADLFTISANYHLLQNKKGSIKIIAKPATQTQTAGGPQLHNKVKKRIVKTAGNIYLQQLGIISQDGHVKKDMQDKYKQINRYIETIEGIIKDTDFSNGISVVDMGCGKGYLTFALYDYLNNHLGLKTSMLGVELRQDLVDNCTGIATAAGFSHLQFIQGSIADTPLPHTDMLIALHACDTATDDAIYKGIEANAAIIICAPCCHKQIRKQMQPDNALSSITKHGILLERQAEIVTDSIRALLLEYAGYKTKVFEFISTEHTPKNVMIAAVKADISTTRKDEALEKINSLKRLFNITEHQLEMLLLKQLHPSN